MHFVALASDYDGTLAHQGRVDPSTIEQLSRLKAANKIMLLVTGRALSELQDVFRATELFDVVVAENGAVLYSPETREKKIIAASPPAALVAALRSKRMAPLFVGDCVVATHTPNEHELLGTLQELGLDWQLTFNKGAVMCLPPGVNKASGLRTALQGLKLSPHNVVGVGDAENDIAFLRQCGCAVAVANALGPVKAMADMTTSDAGGKGVAELIQNWLRDPYALFGTLHRHDLYLGQQTPRDSAVSLPSMRGATLIAGSSGGGKSTLTRLLVERITEAHYQACIIDPEADYSNLQSCSHLGDAHRTPSADEVLGIIASSQSNVAVNLMATDIPQRAEYFADLLGRLNALRTNSGRPHWLVLDEAHHLLPRTTQSFAIPIDFSSALMITSRPEYLARHALAAVGTLIAVGEGAIDVITQVCELIGMPPPLQRPSLLENEVLVWCRDKGTVRVVRIARPKEQHERHSRKYADGRLGEDNSFYFRGPGARLNLRAFNLAMFLELATGVDDATWMFHLQRGDYARWFREVIKDESLASETAALEAVADANASRAAVADAVKRRYAPSGLG